MALSKGCGPSLATITARAAAFRIIAVGFVISAVSITLKYDIISKFYEIARRGVIPMETTGPVYGDIIYVLTRAGTRHYGVYIGHGKVIHVGRTRPLLQRMERFITPWMKRVKSLYEGVPHIQETTLTEFIDAAKFYYICKMENLSIPSVSIRTPQETVQRAKMCLGDRNHTWAANEGEYFPFWCKVAAPKGADLGAVFAACTTVFQPDGQGIYKIFR